MLGKDTPYHFAQHFFAILLFIWKTFANMLPQDWIWEVLISRWILRQLDGYPPGT